MLLIRRGLTGSCGIQLCLLARLFSFGPAHRPLCFKAVNRTEWRRHRRPTHCACSSGIDNIAHVEALGTVDHEVLASLTHKRLSPLGQTFLTGTLQCFAGNVFHQVLLARLYQRLQRLAGHQSARSQRVECCLRYGCTQRRRQCRARTERVLLVVLEVAHVLAGLRVE